MSVQSPGCSMYYTKAQVYGKASAIEGDICNSSKDKSSIVSVSDKDTLYFGVNAEELLERASLMQGLEEGADMQRQLGQDLNAEFYADNLAFYEKEISQRELIRLMKKE